MGGTVEKHAPADPRPPPAGARIGPLGADVEVLEGVVHRPCRRRAGVQASPDRPHHRPDEAIGCVSSVRPAGEIAAELIDGAERLLRG